MPQPTAPRKVQVTVSGGEGSATIAWGGACIGYGIQPPSSTSQYDIEFLDEESFGVSGRTNQLGNCTVKEEFQLYRSNTINIANASEDGTYNVRVWFKI